MQYRVVLHLGLSHELYHCSKIIAGFDALARRGLVQFSIRPAPELGYIVFLTVTELATGVRKSIAVDLKDHSNVFSEPGFARSDVYLKRSVYGPDVERLPPEQRRKVIGFGLNYGCASPTSMPFCVRSWARLVWGEFWRSPRAVVRRRGSLLDNLKVYLTQPDYRFFEQPPDVPMEPVVLFQTRVWEPEDSTEDLAQINEERVALIRFMKKALGTRFRGGVVPTDFARRHYADVLLEQAFRRKEYIRMGQRCLIGVYSRGLHHSLAFKLPEYLAASMCMVSDPLRNELPQPLIPSEHFLQFQTPDQCVAQCERLLRDPDLAREMRRRNWDYYRRYVAPPEHLLHCLRRVF